MGILFRQLEISSCVHRLGKAFVTECKVVGEEESDGIGDICVLKSKILDFPYWFSRQATEKLMVDMASMNALNSAGEGVVDGA